MRQIVSDVDERLAARASAASSLRAVAERCCASETPRTGAARRVPRRRESARRHKSTACRTSASHRACAFSSIASNTGARSPGEELMTCKHLGGRGLLLQRLARLGDQPRVLHRDDRLRGEVLQQRDLLVGERANFLAVDDDHARAARRPCAAATTRRVRTPPSSTQRAPIGSRSIARRRVRSAMWTTRSPRDAAGRARSPDQARSGLAAATQRKRPARRATATSAKVLAVKAYAMRRRPPRTAASPFPASRRTPARDRRARN